MKKKTIISSLILLGCVVSIQAQVVKGTQGTNGASGPGPGTGVSGLFVGAGGASAVNANLTTTNLNVGIGTNTPSESLEVNGNILAKVIKGSSFTTSGLIQAGSITSTGSIQGNSITSIAYVNASKGFFTYNVGIGTTNPAAKLEVVGFSGINNTYTFLNIGDAFDKSRVLNVGSLRETAPTNAGVARLLTFYDVPPSNISPNAQTMFAIEDRNNSNRLRHTAVVNGASLFSLSDKDQSDVFHIYEDGTNAFIDLTKTGSYLTVGGKAVWPVAHNFWVKTGTSKFDHDVFMDTNLGIGTSNFTDGSDTYRLSVKGKIRAEEVRVYTTWADYVFMKDYKLPSLNEVETYIKENGHLQNVPSAKEVTEKGLQLGDMAKIQQEKIEEFTLYLIQQNKEIEELKVQVKALLNKK